MNNSEFRNVRRNGFRASYRAPGVSPSITPRNGPLSRFGAACLMRLPTFALAMVLCMVSWSALRWAYTLL